MSDEIEKMKKKNESHVTDMISVRKCQRVRKAEFQTFTHRFNR